VRQINSIRSKVSKTHNPHKKKRPQFRVLRRMLMMIAKRRRKNATRKRKIRTLKM
jgi:hypothetical protein